MRTGRAILVVTLLSIGVFGVRAGDIPDFGPVTSSPTGKQHTGMIVWMDLLTRDVSAAADFYHAVFDWNFDFSDDGSYAYATHRGKPVAAIASYADDVDGSESLWLASMSVPDVDAAVQRVGDNGGVILEGAEDLPGRGRYALIRDPAGAVVMLLRASGGDPDIDRAAGRWLWNELWTDDVDAATRFYEKVIGYRSVTVKDGSGGEFRVMGRDQLPYASVVKSPLPDVEPNWLAYLLVENVDATARKVLKAGGSVLLPPQKDELNNDIAIVADPAGGVFALQQKEAQ